MSITIYSQPDTDKPNLSNNPIEFYLSTDNMMETYGQICEFQLTTWSTDTYPTDGRVLRIWFYNYKLEFTCTDNPDYSNNEIPNIVDDTSAAVEDWATIVASVLQLHPVINEHWNIQGIGHGAGSNAYGEFLFVGKYPSRTLRLLQTDNPIGSPNFQLWVEEEIGGYPARRKPSFFIGAEILDLAGNTLSSHKLRPDDNGRVRIDISEELGELVEKKIKPITNPLTWVDYANAKYFNLKYFERWDLDKGSPVTMAAGYYVMYGGVGHLLKSIYNENYIDWLDDLQNSKKLLTSREIVSYAKLTQYLMFGLYFNETPSGSVNVKVKAYCTNGLAYDKYENTTGISERYTLYINISRFIEEFLDNQIPDGDRITQLDFLVSESNFPNPDIIHSKTYAIYFLEDLEQGTEFVYKNSWGQYDSIVCTGYEKAKNIYSKVKDIHQNTEWHNKKPIDRVITQLESNVQEQFDISTGLIGKSDLLMLNQMFLSNDVFVKKDDILIPIIIKKKSIKTIDTQKDLQDIKFSYYKAYTEKMVSDISNINTF